MKLYLYNVSRDETEEVSLAFYLKHRFFKFLKVDAPIALTYSIVVPAKAICKKCIEGLACRIYEKRSRKWRKESKAKEQLFLKYFSYTEYKYDATGKNFRYPCKACKQEVGLFDCNEHAAIHEAEK